MLSAVVPLVMWMTLSGLRWEAKPLEVEEVILLLESGLSEETVLAFVRSKEGTGWLTAEAEQRLRDSGATESFLAALRGLPNLEPAPHRPRPPSPNSTELALAVPPTNVYRFGVTTEAVRVPVSVTDKNGRPMTDLKQEDFRVLEDGKPQSIAFFSTERKPLRIGILLDVSGSMEEKISEVADALKHFMELLEPEDQVFVLTFSDRLEMVQNFTSERRCLGAVLESLFASGGTALHDAVIEGLSHLDSTPSESKALVLITDGMDTASASSFKEALQAARRAEAPVYSIGLGHRRRFGHSGGGFIGFLRRHFANVPHGDVDFDDRPLRKLAQETGGQAEILLDLEHHHQGAVDRLKEAAQAIALALRHRYLLGYQPPEEAKKPGWRKIRVEVNRPAVIVRARKGYYTGKSGEVSGPERVRPGEGPVTFTFGRKEQERLSRLPSGPSDFSGASSAAGAYQRKMGTRGELQ